MGRPVQPLPRPGDMAIETSTTIPGSAEDWDWLERSWRQQLSTIAVRLNDFYWTVAESPWLGVQLLDAVAGDGVPHWKDSRQDGDPAPMHPFDSMLWAELINERYLRWCVRHFPPDTPIQDVFAVAPGPPSLVYGPGALGPTGRDAIFQGRFAHPLACLAAFLLDDVAAWAGEVAKKAAQVDWTPEALKIAAIEWRRDHPRGTQEQFAAFAGVSPATVSRHAKFSELDVYLGTDRPRTSVESLSGMQVRKRPR